jgi:uncharacterized protein (TIGR03067 family)
MRRTVWLLVGVLLGVVAMGSDSPKEYDDVMVPDPLEGMWLLKYEGIDFQEVMILRGGTYTINYSDGDTNRGNYRINPTRKPPHLDYIPSKGECRGQTLKRIYQIDGDTLKIAWIRDESDKRRPQGFNDDGIVIKIYKRVKK